MSEESQSNYKFIKVAREGSRVEITLNRPDRRNAFNEEMAGEIIDALKSCELDRDVHSVILAGDERTFCTGADLSGFRDQPEDRYDNYRARYNHRLTRLVFLALYNHTKPVICAVEGYCLGGGMELALFCDFIIAGEGAQFGLPETSLGLIPGAGGTQNLTRLIGRAKAKELIWTGRRFSAAEAKELGIINHLVPKGDALAKAREIADTIGRNAPLSIMVTKQAINRGADMPLPQAFYQEGDLAYLLAFSEDRVEGLKAFAEKRSPNYKGQ